ncbi:mediator of RNA polymerase II transcription subunit 1 [Gallus gallus]|uniref:Mediator of RNA polymerase II transcription subunit 1 n=1 Tax=Gallus gallus TaxID=9031 RepID=E1BUI5_CHICK|nr:mediator of RNA polymerase II transcription subunit 1 [Gallus gallus]XP_418125.3 mediator of RNA polymerase II transcription subunit 1 [Gallus gallus]|eukprot:XP_418125.3 mediator of RNA polymerase II transcription subunit 1 [Gallus gallus]
MKAVPGGAEEAEKLNKMSTLLERLHAKYNQNRPWTETMKLVRQVMEKRVVMNSGGHQHLVSCLETLQKALKVSSLPAMTDRLESIARQNGLGSHLSANGTECYITSDMFYVEVQLDPTGLLCDVKVAHHGENPVSCPELVQHLREKNFDEFSKHLRGLVNLYKLPGDNKLKTKMYLALQSLELDLSKMAGMYWQATNANPLDKILHGSVGYLTPRSGGLLMNLKYYVSPYDLFEDGTGAPVILHESNVPRSLGMNVSVTIEGTMAMYKLPIAPLIMGSHPVDSKGTPSFSSITSANSVDLPACFFLKFPRPIPVSRAFIQKLQGCTGIPLFDTAPTFVPLYELITQFELSKEADPIPLNHNMRFYAALPGQQHCYFLNKDAPLPDGRSLQGTLISKIAFQHPGRVPIILNLIRHQVAYNTLIGSCVKRTVLKEDSPGILQFEVCPLSDSCFSVSFQHPVNDSLVCVVMDVQDSTHVNCKLYKGLSDALICTDDFIAKVVQRCMSIPVTMRAIRRKAETIQADTPALSLIAETVEDMVKKNLPPASSPGYGMTTGSNPMSGTTTPTNTFPGGPITTLFNMSISMKERHDSVGHGEDFSKVSQNPILTSLLQITGNVGSAIGSSPTPPHHTPPPLSSPAGNTKNHPMLMNLLKENPPQDFSTLYGSSPLERQNSSSGSPRMEMGPGGSKQKKKKSRMPADKPKHQTEDDFQRELFSMDVDSQNPIFDVNMTADTLDTPHITPAPSQCSTPPTTYPQPIPHSQPSIQRMVRLSSSDSIGADVTDILSDIAEEASKLPATNEDCPPIGTPVRDSSSSGHSQSALFDPDVFQTNNSENPYTDPADLIADAAVSPNSDSSNHFFPDGVDFNPDLLNSQSQSGFAEEYFDESSQSGDTDDFKGYASQALSTLGVQVLGGDGGDNKFKGSNPSDTVDFSIIAAASKALGSSDIMEHHSGGQSPLLNTGDLGKEKSQKRVKEGNGSGSNMAGSGIDGKPGKRSRTPSSDGKSKEKLPKRKKQETDGKSPSHSSSNRPFTPPASTGGSKSPGSSGRSQTPPGVATPPIPKITIQIPKGTVTVGKPSSHGQYTSSGSVTSSSSKSHHSHSSSSSSSSSSSTSGKIKSSKSEGSSGSKMSSSLYSSQGGSSSGPSKSSAQSVGKPGSSPITKHGLSSGSGSTKMKPQGKPSSLMNPSMSKPNISPSHSRPSGGSDKLASPMKPVPGTPPSSKAKSPISSGSGGSHMSGTGSSSSMKSSSGMGSSGSMSQKPPPSSNSSTASSSSFSSSGSSMSSSQNQHGSSKGKSPSRNKKPSLTAVIDKLKHGVVTSGPGGDDPMDGQMGPSSNSSSHTMSSKHNMSGGEFQGKREKSDKEKSKVSVSGGSVDSSKKTSDSKNVGSTGVAKIIISKHDGGSPSIKAKVTLQKPGEGGGDSLRPQMASSKSYGSPLISGSTPKHERCSPSHSKSPAYTPQNIDSESESGSSIAEKSYQNSPSSDDGIRPLPEYSSEKHKKHKKEKKKVKDKDRDRDRDRDKDRDKKKSHSMKPESWSKSPISADQSLSMASSAILSAERPSRPSPEFLIGEEDDDLMDVALIGN